MSFVHIPQLLIIRTLLKWYLLVSEEAHPRLLAAIFVDMQRGPLALMWVVSLTQRRNSVCLVGLFEAMAVIPVGRMRILSREVSLRVHRPTIWSVVCHTQLVQVDLSRMLVLVARKTLEILNGS